MRVHYDLFSSGFLHKICRCIVYNRLIEEKSMVERKLVVVSILAAILSIAVVGLMYVAARPQGAELNAAVVRRPNSYTLDTNRLNPWNAELSLRGKHNAATEIDALGILLEGLYSPSEAAYPLNDRLIVPFKG